MERIEDVAENTWVVLCEFAARNRHWLRDNRHPVAVLLEVVTKPLNQVGLRINNTLIEEHNNSGRFS